MAFEQYDAKPRDPRRPETISFAVFGASRTVNGYTLSLAFGTAVVEERGWKNGDRVALYFGTGEDKGKLLIKHVGGDEKQGCKLTFNGGKAKTPDAKRGLKIQKIIKAVPPIEDFINKSLEAVKVHWEWDEAQEGIVLDIPEGFFAG